MTASPSGTSAAARRLALLRVLVRRVAGGGVRRSLVHVARHPGRLVVHASRLARGEVTGLSNRYGVLEAAAGEDPAAQVSFVTDVTGLDRSLVEACLRELDADARFREALEARYASARPDWATTFRYGRFAQLYAIVRAIRPAVVLETGVHDGLSSTLILKALEANGRGRLVSVDRPSTDLPVTVRGAGWLIPDELRDRWELHVGDAVDMLPVLAAQLAPIDLFLHDSDHAASHRRFEFTTVRPHLAPGGVVLSDDDAPADGVLTAIAGAWGRRYVPPSGGDVGIGAVVPWRARPRTTVA